MKCMAYLAIFSMLMIESLGQINVTECNNFCINQDPFATCDVDFTIISPVSGDQVNACTCITDFLDVCPTDDSNCNINGNPDGFLIVDYGEICDRNECDDTILNTCDDQVGICENIIGDTQVTCSCPTTGYLDVNGDGTNCTDIDECADNSAGCDVNANCINIPGTFICECNEGFEGDGINNCTDIDECSSSALNDCQEKSPGSTCKNTQGSFICDCPAINTICDSGQEFKCGWTFSFWRRRRGWSYGFGWKRFYCGCVDAGINMPYTDITIVGIILIISLLINFSVLFYGCRCIGCRCIGCRCIKTKKNKNTKNKKHYDIVSDAQQESESEVINVKN